MSLNKIIQYISQFFSKTYLVVFLFSTGLTSAISYKIWKNSTDKFYREYGIVKHALDSVQLVNVEVEIKLTQIQKWVDSTKLNEQKLNKESNKLATKLVKTTAQHKVEIEKIKLTLDSAGKAAVDSAVVLKNIELAEKDKIHRIDSVNYVSASRRADSLQVIADKRKESIDRLNRELSNLPKAKKEAKLLGITISNKTTFIVGAIASAVLTEVVLPQIHIGKSP